VEDGKRVFDTSKEVFVTLRGKEYYRTVGFKKLAYIYGDTNESLRKTAKLINRFRHQQQGGTPSHTLQESTEREGQQILDYVKDQSNRILEQNGIFKDGTYQANRIEYGQAKPVWLPFRDIFKAANQCSDDFDKAQLLTNPVGYEDPKTTTNIAIDDINVKRQNSSRTKEKDIGIILDWYHFRKKCIEKLGMAMRSRVIRNEVLEQLMPMLWHGLTQKAIDFLNETETSLIKNQTQMTELISYLERNKPYIPCYEIRKKLGLKNSSAIGEKK
jgi:hypothetical protein